ncbi:hypothetical protein WJX72_005391 [[Myrmecia] bisecta]|uniref:Uncharacterized protein n=1 Tax=[Myrmecia] bisecta TaxID=41462 RepID=A0AAW1PAD2_9CHLO
MTGRCRLGQAVADAIALVQEARWRVEEGLVVEGHPLSVKAAISGVVYALGDLTAQSYEGRSLAECDSARILRSALCGFLAHGPLAHTYYQAVDRYFTISPLFTDAWFVPMIKIALDQTVWALTWNSLYYATLGMMKLESPSVIGSTLSQSWWGCLRAGWRMWPIAHLVTYTVIPTQHKLLWVDMCELAWVTVLSYYGQQQRALAVAAVAAAGGADAWEGAPVTQVACALPNTGNFADEILRGMQVERSGICFEDEEGDVLCRPIEEVYAEAAIAEVHGMAALSKVPIDSGDHNLTGLPR